MNKNSITETVLFDEQYSHRRYEGPLPCDSLGVPAKGIARQLIWSSCKPDDWEVLVYKRDDLWEVCFFRWPLHHEHATGSSFNSVRQRAEQRIRTLEARGLKTTEWRQTIH